MILEHNHLSAPEEKNQSYLGIFAAVSDGLIIQDAKTHRIVEANAAAVAMYGYSREEFIGLHVKEYIHPDNWRLFAKSAKALQQPGDLFESTEIHVQRDGSQFYAESRTTAYTYQALPCLLSVVRDISKRIQAEQHLRQLVAARESEQSTLLDVSRTLASTLELKPDLILDQLRFVVQYNQAAFFVLENSALRAVSLRGEQQLENAQPLSIHLDGPEMLAWLFNEHRPIRVADVSSADKQAQFLRSLLKNDASRLLDGMQSWMWVPLAVKGRIIGGVGIAHAERDYFTSHHADLALIVANQAAITMINTELHKNAQSLAILQERQRLAESLHHAVNQSLFSAGLIAEVLPRLWDRDQDLARQSLEDLRRLTRGAMAEMRALLAELRPSTLTDADLSDLLRLLGNAFTGRTNVPARFTVVGEGVLPAEVQVAIYRVCQEALNNVAKHASASSVEMYLKHEDSNIELSIIDNGIGFDPIQTVSGHYGLSMMRERAEAVGAHLSITSQPGQGAELIIHWTKTASKETV